MQTSLGPLGLGISLAGLGALRAGGGVVVPSPVLQPLTLSTYQFPENAAPGTVIAAVIGKISLSTLSVSPADGRFAISGNNLIVGLTASGFGNYPISITETWDDLFRLSEMALMALSSATFDSTRTRSDSTRTDGGLDIRATLQNWNVMLASLAARRGG